MSDNAREAAEAALRHIGPFLVPRENIRLHLEGLAAILRPYMERERREGRIEGLREVEGQMNFVPGWPPERTMPAGGPLPNWVRRRIAELRGEGGE